MTPQLSAGYVNENCIEVVRTNSKVVSQAASFSMPFSCLDEECQIVNEIVDSINAVDNVGTLNRNHGVDSVFYCVEGCFVINNSETLPGTTAFYQNQTS